MRWLERQADGREAPAGVHVRKEWKRRRRDAAGRANEQGKMGSSWHARLRTVGTACAVWPERQSRRCTVVEG